MSVPVQLSKLQASGPGDGSSPEGSRGEAPVGGLGCSSSLQRLFIDFDWRYDQNLKILKIHSLILDQYVSRWGS